MERFCIKCGNHIHEYKNRDNKKIGMEYFMCKGGGEHLYATETLEGDW